MAAAYGAAGMALATPLLSLHGNAAIQISQKLIKLTPWRKIDIL